MTAGILAQHNATGIAMGEDFQRRSDRLILFLVLVSLHLDGEGCFFEGRGGRRK